MSWTNIARTVKENQCLWYHLGSYHISSYIFQCISNILTACCWLLVCVWSSPFIRSFLPYKPEFKEITQKCQRLYSKFSLSNLRAISSILQTLSRGPFIERPESVSASKALFLIKSVSMRKVRETPSKNGRFSLIYAYLIFLQQEQSCENENHGIMFSYYQSQSTDIHFN